YLMMKDPETGLFWYELTGLNAGQKYVFQYFIDGEIRVGDPYADEVADADNDQFIPETVHPDIAPYNQPYGPASVLQPGQESFDWADSEQSWSPPAKEDLIIYELLLRDFLGTHSYDDLIDTLSYIKRLGVNAIELMPIMEFEGNSSWGYNPSHFFAVDKYYGTKSDFKRFVQAAHAEGIAVIMDMVLNHAFGQSPMVRMYFEDGAPSNENPWFNRTARHPFNVGYDFNHESPYTQDFVDSVNNYWLTEYHVDGYRFDLSKGFTQVNSGNDVGAWTAYDASRIAILKRMAGEIWDDHPGAYVILEHFGNSGEEAELAAEGMMPWRNLHGEAIASLTGTGGNLGNAQSLTHVSYMESHDE
ncbi:MAG: alpha-amylase family glycosyl hydrolase, partial [Cyclobacteriaceae bacterium]